MDTTDDVTGPYLAPGTWVRYNGLDEGGPEYGIVVHCWIDETLQCHECYIAFFGSSPPVGKPIKKPYVLRYLSSSLTVIDGPA